MSVLIESTFANPTTEIWLKKSSTSVQSYTESMIFNSGIQKPQNLTALPLGSANFPISLSSGITASGWVLIRSTYSTNMVGNLFISASTNPIGSQLYVVTIASGNNFINLTGLQAVSNGTSYTLYFNPTAGVPDTINGITIVPYMPSGTTYASMPTNTWAVAGFLSNPTARVVLRGI